MNLLALHEEGIQVSRTFHSSADRMIEILRDVYEVRGYREFKSKNIYEYARDYFKLSEDVAYYFVSIAKKAREVPELLEALKRRETTWSKARKIVPVLTPENQEKWLNLICTGTTRAIEKAIATEKPEAAIKDSIKPKSAGLYELRAGIHTGTEGALSRAREILAQKLGRMPTLNETIAAMAGEYLHRHDPLEKAERARPRKSSVPGRKKPRRYSMTLVHAINKRDGAQCTHVGRDGERCPERKWIHFHHIIPVEVGGEDSLTNMITLCAEHHRWRHPEQRPHSRSRHGDGCPSMES